MSLERVEGFDHFSTGNMAQKGWSVPSAGNMAAGRFGGQAWNTFNSGNVWLPFPLGSLVTRYIGLAFNHGGVASNTVANGTNLLWLCDVTSGTPALNGSNTQLQLKVVNGFIQAVCGSIDGNGSAGTILGTASTGPTIIVGNWYYLEILLTVGGSGSLIVNLWSGGGSTTVLNLSGVTTQHTANATFNGIWLNGTANNVNTQYDDMYVNTPAGTVNNGFLGEVRVQTIYPVTDGHASQWTPNTGSGNASKVNETLVDDDTTYVTSATPGQLDAYNHAAIATQGVIFGVQSNVTARKDDAGTRSVAFDFYDGLTDYINSNAHGLQSSYQDFLDIYETDPANGLPWTIAGFNAKQIGVSMVS